MEHINETHDPIQEELSSLRRRVAELEKALTQQSGLDRQCRATEQELRLLCNHVSDGWASLENGSIRKMNMQLCSILARTEHDMQGRKFSDLFTAEDRSQVEAIIDKAASSINGVSQTEACALRENGEQMALVLTAYRPGGGDLVHVLVRDISRTEQGHEKLDARDRYFRSLIENSMDACMVFDDTSTIRYLNPAYQDILGYEPEERVGTSLYANVHPDDKAHAVELLARQLRSPGRSTQMELRSRHKDGSWRYIEASGTNLMLDPNVRGFVANIRDITPRKQAEEALRSKEEHFRALIENSSDAIAIINATGEIQYESPSSQRIIGYGVESIRGKSILGFVHPDDQSRVLSLLARLTAEPGQVISADIRFRRSDGEWRVLEGTAKNLLQEPHVAGIVVNYRDITERRQAEEDLRDSEERYRLLAENLSDVIWTMGPDHRYTYISPSVTRLRGYSQEEAMALSLPENMAPASLETASQVIAEQLKGDHTDMETPFAWISLESELTCKDGSTVWTENSITVLRDEQGKVTGYLGVTRDIAERKKAEEALRESEAKYGAVVEHAMDGVIIWQDDYAKFANPAAARISGYSPEEICATPFLNTVPEAKRKEIGGLYRSLIAGRQTVATYQIDIQHKKGQRKPVEVSTARIQYQGRPAVMGVIRDITSRKMAEEERVQHAATLARAEALKLSRQRIVKMQESLRKEIANEIHGSVQNRLILLMHKLKDLEGIAPGGQLAEELGEVHKKLEDLLNHHLRPISHRLFPSILRQGLVPALQSLCDHFETAVTIDLQIEDSLIDTERINRKLIPEDIRLSACRIAEEALNNIVKHSAADNVAVSLSRVKDQLQLTIRDNGRGFDPGGVTTGMGMLMIQDYIEVAGGTWSIDARLDQGTELSASFPLPRIE